MGRKRLAPRRLSRKSNGKRKGASASANFLGLSRRVDGFVDRIQVNEGESS